MQLTDGDPDVVHGGSVLQAEDSIVMDRVHAGLAEVAPDARIRVLDVAPVAGALAAALELAGSRPDQVATARDELRRIRVVRSQRDGLRRTARRGTPSHRERR
jgi:hypothetical protein